MKLNELRQSQSTAPSSSVEVPSMVTTDRYMPMMNNICSSAKPTEFYPTAGYHNADTGYLPVGTGFKKHQTSKLLPTEFYPTSTATEYCSNTETRYLPGEQSVKPTSLLNIDNHQQTTDSISITMDQSSTSTMDTVLQNTQYQQSLLNPRPQNNINTNNNSGEKGNNFPFRYLRPLYVDTGVPLSQQPQKHIHTNENLLRIADPQPQQRATKLQQQQNSIPEHSSSETGEHKEMKKEYDNNKKEEQQQTPLLNEVEKLKTKEELKEFWRHKLLQPNPLDTLRKESEEKHQDHPRPYHLDSKKSKDIPVHLRNQY